MFSEGKRQQAQEHHATELAHQLISQMNTSMVCHDRGKGNLVVTCVGNETHGLGSRMVPDFLEMDGWDVTTRVPTRPTPTSYPC